MGNAEQEEPYGPITTLLPRDLRRQLKERAALEERSLSSVIRRALREHLADPICRMNLAFESGAMLRPVEVAELLGISASSVYRLLRAAEGR